MGCRLNSYASQGRWADTFGNIVLKLSWKTLGLRCSSNIEVNCLLCVCVSSLKRKSWYVVVLFLSFFLTFYSHYYAFQQDTHEDTSSIPVLSQSDTSPEFSCLMDVQTNRHRLIYSISNTIWHQNEMWDIFVYPWLLLIKLVSFMYEFTTGWKIGFHTSGNLRLVW